MRLHVSVCGICGQLKADFFSNLNFRLIVGNLKELQPSPQDSPQLFPGACALSRSCNIRISLQFDLMRPEVVGLMEFQKGSIISRGLSITTNSLSDDDPIMKSSFLIFLPLCPLRCTYKVGKLWRSGELFNEDIVYPR